MVKTKRLMDIDYCLYFCTTSEGDNIFKYKTTNRERVARNW